MPLPTETRNEIERFVAEWQEILDRHYATNFPTLTPDTLSVRYGRRYAKVIGNSSVRGFIDLTNGNVLKPASWNAPAKHARGNVSSPASETITPAGNVPYLRG